MTFTGFLEGIYDFFHKLVYAIAPFDYQVVYPLAVLIIVGWALLVLISKSFCYTTRLSKDCAKVTKYLNKLDKKAAKQNKKNKGEAVVEAKITSDNVDAFSKKYFGKHCVKNLRDRWNTYLRYSAGVPSDFVTGEHCLSKKGVGRGISRGRILAYRYGAGIITMLAFGYLLFNNTNNPAISEEQINGILINIVKTLPGLVLVISVALICDLIINWVFSLADNGAVKNFYDMTKVLDEKVELNFDQYAGYDATYDGAYQDAAYQDGSYNEQPYDGSYAEPVYDDQAYAEPVYEEPVYEEPVEQTPVEEESVAAEPEYKEFVAPQPVYEEPVYEEPAPAVAPAPVEKAVVETKAPSKVDKIEMLTDKAIKSNATKKTYMGLAKMLVDLNKVITDPDDKARIKVCAAKLLAKVK